VAPGRDDQLGRAHGRLRQHGVERGQYAVDVGEDGDGRGHGSIFAESAGERRGYPLRKTFRVS
jgi:hypothetical protein